MTGNNGVDFVEVGRGKESKVLGTNNSVSEYGHTALAIITYLSQFLVITWIILTFYLVWEGYGFRLALFVSGIVNLACFGLAIIAVLKIIFLLKMIIEPQPVRDSKGRFARRAGVYNVGNHVADIETAANGVSSWVDR